MVVRDVDFWLSALDSATAEELDAIVEAYVADEEDRAAHPLARAKLWHRSSPRTSQRETAQACIDAGTTFAFVLGGNRTGKSELLAMLVVVYALGADHPDVVRWAALNGLDLSGVPVGPGTVWHCALTSNDSRRYVRTKAAAYLPPDAVWRNREGQGEAEARFNGGRSRIVFKDVSQGRAGFQGDAPRMIGFDEEPPDYAVIRESTMRLVDHAGRMVFAMTPLYGWTELLRDYVETPDAGTVVRWLHGADNPHVPQEFLAGMLAKFGEHERAARARGEIVALEGRVYREWARHIHVVPPMPIPTDWPVYVGWDFGARNPTAIIAAALDPADDVLHLIDLRYVAESPLSEHAAWVKSRAWWPRARWVVADSAARAERLTLANDHDIVTVPSPKGVREGINAVAERLRVSSSGRPGLVVHQSPTMEPLIREIEGYVWDVTNTKNDLPDKPRKKADHAMDALAYLCRRLAME